MFDVLVEKLKAQPRKIVFTEGTDARILEASARLLEDNFLTPVLVSVQAVSKWERGCTYPDLALLLPIAHLFGVTLDELFSNERE